jgi:hypothetical protein
MCVDRSMLWLRTMLLSLLTMVAQRTTGIPSQFLFLQRHTTILSCIFCCPRRTAPCVSVLTYRKHCERGAKRALQKRYYKGVEIFSPRNNIICLELGVRMSFKALLFVWSCTPLFLIRQFCTTLHFISFLWAHPLKKVYVITIQGALFAARPHLQWTLCLLRRIHRLCTLFMSYSEILVGMH